MKYEVMTFDRTAGEKSIVAVVEAADPRDAILFATGVDPKRFSEVELNVKQGITCKTLWVHDDEVFSYIVRLLS